MAYALPPTPQGGPSALPLLWIGIGILAVCALAVAIAVYESRKAVTLQERNPGSTVWVVHLYRSTRYLLVSDDEVALVRGSGEGPRWPVAEVYSAAVGPVRFPRTRAKRFGLSLEVGPNLRLERHVMIFPRIAGFGASSIKAYAAVKAINAAKNRPRPSA